MRPGVWMLSSRSKAANGMIDTPSASDKQKGPDMPAGAGAPEAPKADDQLKPKPEAPKADDQPKPKPEALKPGDQPKAAEPDAPKPGQDRDRVASSDRAAVAIAAARAQLGKPYEFGKQGPDKFDCSGLVQHAYRQAGIELPRTAAQQEQA